MEIVFDKSFRSEPLYQSCVDDDLVEKESLEVSSIDESSFLHCTKFDFSPPTGFVFIDGTVQHITSGKIRSGNFDVSFDVFFMCIAAGYDNGELIESKILKFLFLYCDYLNQLDIKSILPNIRSEGKTSYFPNYGYKVLQVPKEKGILEYAANLLREEEFEFLYWFCGNGCLSDRKYIIVIDGNIRLKKLKDDIENFIVVGVVKNPLNLYQSENEIIDLSPGFRTKLFKVKDQKSLKSKFSFFLKLGQDELKTNELDFLRIDFIGKPFENLAYAVYFSDFIKNKILSFSSSIGDRAPKNLVPLRILEKRIKAFLGNENIRKRKTEEELKRIFQYT